MNQFDALTQAVAEMLLATHRKRQQHRQRLRAELGRVERLRELLAGTARVASLDNCVLCISALLAQAG